VTESFELSSETKSLLETRFHGSTGVNIDEEIAQLQNLQTSYQATARVIQVAQRMLDALEGAIQ
jgi:flagellar hook-associated protein 1 FlgK